jgi:uncharacterized protein YgbK (DUF1537 family)
VAVANPTGSTASGEKVLLAYYGDDFSGTTATAEALYECGVPTVIFTEPPDPTVLARNFPAVRAVGVAGLARTLPAREMQPVLTPVFEAFKRYHPPMVLYKVCSTFDSSSQTGSIGRAMEIGRSLFSPGLSPILPAAPKLGRYTVFGHHFAALGDGEVYRLDRHPSMRSHPVTPMDESDLRLHLGRQTSLEIGLINLLDLNRGATRVRRRLDELRDQHIQAVLFDCVELKHLELACRLVWEQANPERPAFFIGSQELGYGLGRVWQKAGLLAGADVAKPGAPPSQQQPLLVLSGSCATMTGRQIDWAAGNGFAELPVATEALLDPARRPAEQKRIVESCQQELARGRSVVVHTAAGPEDPRITRMQREMKSRALSREQASRSLGDALGEIGLSVLSVLKLRRLLVTGGDTAGRIQSHLQVKALQIAKPVGIAAPLCYLYSRNSALNGLEVAFKGGQIGTVDYFGRLREAEVPVFTEAALGSFPPSS